jgi:hypothetical protein
MLPLHVAILELITLIASLLCLSFSTRRLFSPFTSIPYNAQFASVAWRRPASLSTKNLHVCLASMATELLLDALLSAGTNCQPKVPRLSMRAWRCHLRDVHNLNSVSSCCVPGTGRTSKGSKRCGLGSTFSIRFLSAGSVSLSCVLLSSCFDFARLARIPLVSVVGADF